MPPERLPKNLLVLVLALLAFLITLFTRETVLRQSTSDIAAEQAAEPLHEQVWNTPDDHVEHEHGPRIREF